MTERQRQRAIAMVDHELTAQFKERLAAAGYKYCKDISFPWCTGYAKKGDTACFIIQHSKNYHCVVTERNEYFFDTYTQCMLFIIHYLLASVHDELETSYMSDFLLKVYKRDFCEYL